jgi:hypothetical protein
VAVQERCLEVDRLPGRPQEAVQVGRGDGGHRVRFQVGQGIGGVGFERGAFDRQFVGEHQRRLVRVRRAADVLQQRGEVDVRDGRLVASGGAGQRHGDETGPRRGSDRLAHPEIRHAGQTEQ